MLKVGDGQEGGERDLALTGPIDVHNIPISLHKCAKFSRPGNRGNVAYLGFSARCLNDATRKEFITVGMCLGYVT